MEFHLLIDPLPLWALFLVTLTAVLLAVEGGYRLGRYRGRRPEQEKESSVGPLVGAALGLLAFLLAFTFGMAASLFEARRKVLLDEVNAIGTAYLRADLVAEPHRSEIRGLFREYVDVRLDAVQSGQVQQGIVRSEALHTQLWAQAVAVAAMAPDSQIVVLFIESLNEVIDLHMKRVTAGLRSRIPPTIWLALYAVSLLGMATLGYHSGLAGKYRSPAIPALALAFSLVILMIADLDRPAEGVFRVSQQGMVELRNRMSPAQP